MEPCCGALIAWHNRQPSSRRLLPRHKLPLLSSHNHAQISCLAHPVHHLLAHSGAGIDLVAHRLANINPTEVDRDQCWRGAGVNQDRSVPSGPDAWLSGVTTADLFGDKLPRHETNTCSENEMDITFG